MDTYLTENDLREIYAALPEDLKHAIFAPETMDVYNVIRERYGLDGAQREQLSIQAGLLMMGMTEPKEFVLELSEALKIPRDKAAFIAQEVNRDILHNVRDSLKEIHGLTSSQAAAPVSGVVERTPVAPTPPLSASPSVFEQKLGSGFKVAPPPPIGVPTYEREEPPQIPPPPTSSSAKVDPYREPVE